MSLIKGKTETPQNLCTTRTSLICSDKLTRQTECCLLSKDILNHIILEAETGGSSESFSSGLLPVCWTEGHGAVTSVILKANSVWHETLIRVVPAAQVDSLTAARDASKLQPWTKQRPFIINISKATSHCDSTVGCNILQ